MGMCLFSGVFALPALLFKSMVELNFSTVSWTFLLAIFLAKAILFTSVIAMAAFVLKRKGIGKGAIYAIFATQSNDFALGYPIGRFEMNNILDLLILFLLKIKILTYLNIELRSLCD